MFRNWHAGCEINKITYLADRVGPLDKVLPFLSKYFDHIRYRNNRIGDFVPKGISKAEGARLLLDHIPDVHGTVYAFGDSVNDLPLYKLADISIAIGEAEECVRHAADHVTTGLWQNGILNALSHYKLY